MRASGLPSVSTHGLAGAAAQQPIEGIQILRAVAALMVVLHHARHSVPGAEHWPEFGASGVDIFFVISGFVMAHTTRGLSHAAGFAQRLADAGSFMRKRIVRVVPLYWLALLWTSRRELLQGRAGSDLLLDFLFLPHANAIYPDMLWPTVIQGWTLNYEMFFYALFALTLLSGARRTAVLLAVVALLVACGLALPAASAGPGAGVWSVVQRFYLHDILLEFGFGVLLQRWVAHRPAPAWPRAVFVLLAALGFVLLALGHDRWPRGLMDGLPALLIVWASLHACAGLRSRGLELLGAASYAIYLFHWAAFGAVKPVMARLGPGVADHPLQMALSMGLHLLVAVLVGVAVHLWIETPLQRLARRRPAAPPTATLAA